MQDHTRTGAAMAVAPTVLWLFVLVGPVPAHLGLASPQPVPAGQELRLAQATEGDSPGAGETKPLAGVTFADATGTLYAPLRELGEALEMTVSWDSQSQQAQLDGESVSGEDTRALIDGTQLIPVRKLGDWNASVSWDKEAATARISRQTREVAVAAGAKRVAISLDEQELRAWQGGRLVLETRVSSGRPGHDTPTGSFTAGPLKRRMLISKKYNDAKMPWSVQVRGDVVIHGYPSVPPRAASHGCIRMPLTGANPAHWFYTWVETGTPIEIADDWPASAAS